MYLGWFLVISIVTVIKIVRAFRVIPVVRVVTGITVVKDLNLHSNLGFNGYRFISRVTWVISIVTVQLFDYLMVYELLR